MPKTDIDTSELCCIFPGRKVTLVKTGTSKLAKGSAYKISVAGLPPLDVISPETYQLLRHEIDLVKSLCANRTYKGQQIIGE